MLFTPPMPLKLSLVDKLQILYQTIKYRNLIEFNVIVLKFLPGSSTICQTEEKGDIST